MRRTNSKALKKPNGRDVPSGRGPSLSEPIKVRNSSTIRSEPLNARKNARMNSSKRANWKDDAALNDILTKGIQHNNEGDFPAAIRAFKKAIRKSPRCSVAYWLLGGVYYSFLHDAFASLPYFKRAVKLSPKTEMASLGLFHALWDIDRIDDALEELKRFQLLTNWSSQDYLKIVNEIKEKWLNSSKTKKRAKSRK